MGLDYAEKVARAYRKGLDRSRVELNTPTLFTQQPECAPRSYAARVRNGQTLTVGDELCVRLEGEQVLAYRGLTPVATFDNPSAELKQTLAATSDACGIVRDVHDIARTVEIVVC